MGRNKLRSATGPGPRTDGVLLGENPPFHTPCFVMAHYEREPITAGGTTYLLRQRRPAEVLQLAREAAAAC